MAKKNEKKQHPPSPPRKHSGSQLVIFCLSVSRNLESFYTCKSCLSKVHIAQAVKKIFFQTGVSNQLNQLDDCSQNIFIRFHFMDSVLIMFRHVKLQMSSRKYERFVQNFKMNI